MDSLTTFRMFAKENSSTTTKGSQKSRRAAEKDRSTAQKTAEGGFVVVNSNDAKKK
jgi:hypothetical protein